MDGSSVLQVFAVLIWICSAYVHIDSEPWIELTHAPEFSLILDFPPDSPVYRVPFSWFFWPNTQDFSLCNSMTGVGLREVPGNKTDLKKKRKRKSRHYLLFPTHWLHRSSLSQSSDQQEQSSSGVFCCLCPLCSFRA